MPRNAIFEKNSISNTLRLSSYEKSCQSFSQFNPVQKIFIGEGIEMYSHKIMQIANFWALSKNQICENVERYRNTILKNSISGIPKPV